MPHLGLRNIIFLLTKNIPPCPLPLYFNEICPVVLYKYEFVVVVLVTYLRARDQLQKPNHTWEDNIRIDRKELWLQHVGCLAQESEGWRRC
jgi:hypothetical protein